MSDFTNHGDKPIEFCGDQEGWIAVGSLTSDSSNSPCYPRAILLGVGLGPSGKMHPSNIAAMLTIEQATDLRARLTEAMGVDRPAPTPTPAPGLDLDAVEASLSSPASKTWLVTADKPVLPTLDDDSTETWVLSEEQARDIATTAHHDGATEIAIECHAVMPFSEVTALIAEVRALRAAAEEREADMHARIRAGYDKTVADAWRAEVEKRDAEIARLTAELAAARAVTPDVEASRPATVGGLLATACEGEIVEFVSPDGMYHQAVVAGGRLLSRRWQHALSHSPGDWTLYAFWLDGAYLRLPARLVPAAEAAADPNQRGPLPKGG